MTIRFRDPTTMALESAYGVDDLFVRPASEPDPSSEGPTLEDGDDGWWEAEVETMLREGGYIDGMDAQPDAPPEDGARETSAPTISWLGELVTDDDGLPSHCRTIGGDPAVLREWVFISSEGRFFHVGTGEEMPRTSFDLAFASRTPSIEFTKPDGETEVKKFGAARTLVEFLGGTVVTAQMYRPDLDQRVFNHEQKRFVNSYLPGSVPMAARDWQSHNAWQTVRDHIQNVLPDGADTIIEWMAHNVQHPGLKINWVPVLIGVPGDGKTSIAQALGAAMGTANVGTVSTDALFSPFSSWATGKAVQVLEELRVTGQNRHTAMDKLKPFVSNAHVPVHRKGKDEINAVNVTNYLACSNHMDALALTEDDRRWAVWRTRFESRPQMRKELTKAYFDSLHAAIASHPNVIRAWLLSLDLSDFDRTAPPETSIWKSRMIEASRSSTEVEIRAAIELGGFGIGDAILATDCLNEAVHRQCGRKIPTSVLSTVLERLGWAKVAGADDGKRPQIKWRGKARTIYYRRAIFAIEPDAETARLHLPDGDDDPYAPRM